MANPLIAAHYTTLSPNWLSAQILISEYVFMPTHPETSLGTIDQSLFSQENRHQVQTS